MDSEQTISVMQIFGILRKHIKAIWITTLVVFLASIFVTFFVMTPFVYSYSAKTTNVISDLFSQQTYFDGENERLNIVGQLYTTLPRNKLKIYQRKILQVSSFLDSKA
ncbi:Wzz/FepE/Etk N-terminal domain-containing protein [Fructilactobacillus sanfranciscensis]|uniref:Wzz/FepE/Etk N-terminal domain-containing protein n=1 Tax=Fructilactobacillus sanfranciscensis TaxID=1625 RepID=UPI0005A2D33E|nr:Wzz/FepE/Etk N-terminal domain-containing protein [Fructilactobacillus sanfranciscensis]POH17621.1 hypothetical protein BGL44_06690 [Fructilactobacillus sanfranciscensis]POH21345.1 hypothetical protein BGL47_06510 [Fructilactobacillus sanfranciscensis]